MNEYRQYTNDKAILAYLASAMATKQEVIEAGINKMTELAGSPLLYIETILGFDEQHIKTMRKMYLK